MLGLSDTTLILNHVHRKPRYVYQTGCSGEDCSRGPLSGFAAQIDPAYSIALVSDTDWQNLEYIRRIRNEFAHSPVSLAFDTQSIAERCKLLRLTSFAKESGPDFDEPRKQFSWTVVALVLTLFLRGDQLTSASEPVPVVQLVSQRLNDFFQSIDSIESEDTE